MAVNKVVLGSETLIDLTGDTATAADVAAGATLHLSNGERATGTATYAGAPENNGNANRSNAILYGAVDSTSTDTAFTATVDGLTELVDGTTVMLKNGVVTSATDFTINVNGLGAKPVYTNLAAATRDTTIFNVNYTMLFVYDSTRVEGGGWICYRGYDSNTNTIGYQLRTNSGRKPASDKGYRYRIWLTSPDGAKWVPINISSQTNATTARTLNTRKIDPFGPIAYNSTNGTCDSGANLPVATMWRVYTLTIGYSYVKTLTAWDSVYLKCTPQTDGSAVMADIVQALPTSKDGYIYIHLGTAYSTTGMELQAEHPVYWHDGTGIRLWTGAEPSSGGGSAVSVTRSLTSGTKTATLTIDGTGTDLYAPTPPTASSTTPAMDGTAAVGTSASYARADHVHPTDTSRVAETVTVDGAKTKVRNYGSTADMIYSAGRVVSQVRVNASGADLYAENSSGYAEVRVTPSGVTVNKLTTPTTDTMPTTKKYVDDGLSAKQATLVSGTNIKTINGESLLGSGDLTISGGGSGSGGVTVRGARVTVPKRTSTSINSSVAVNGLDGVGAHDIVLFFGTYGYVVSPIGFTGTDYMVHVESSKTNAFDAFAAIISPNYEVGSQASIVGSGASLCDTTTPLVGDTVTITATSSAHFTVTDAASGGSYAVSGTVEAGETYSFTVECATSYISVTASGGDN